MSDKSDFKKVRKQLSENFIIQGICAAIIECHPHPITNKNQITVERIRWEDFFYDHYSRESDFSDARFMGTAKWLDTDTVKAQFPEQFEEMGDPFDSSGMLFDSKGDLQARKWWIDIERKRLRVIDMYVLDDSGKWCRAIFCERGFFYFEPSEYLDENGSTICPIVAESYEVKQDCSRYGAVRNMIPLQMEVNARRSRMLHLTNHRQVRQTALNAPAANASIAKREAAKADGAIPYGWESTQAADMAQGQMLLMNQSMQDLDRLCPTPAVLGRISSSNESGRARQILQQAGYTELARCFSRLESVEHRTYLQMWYRIRQYFDEPMEIRVTGRAKAPEFLMINEPIIENQLQPVAGPDGQPMIDPTTMQPMVQSVPVTVGMNNRPADMDVDIIISTVPDTVTLEQEVWQQVTELAASLSISPLDPTFDMILKFSPLPNVDEKIEQIKAMRDDVRKQNAEEAAMQAQMGQMAAKTEFDLKTAKAAKDNALAGKSNADAQKTALETQITLSKAMHQPTQPAYPAPPSF